MSKIIILRLIFIIVVLLFVFVALPQTITAASRDCKFTLKSDKNEEPNTYMEDLYITVESPLIQPTGGDYYMVVQDPNDNLAWVGSRGPLPTYKFEDIGGVGANTTRGWQDKVYQVYLFIGNINYSRGLFGVVGRTDVEKEAICIGSFPVKLKPVQDQCKLQVVTKPIDPTTNVVLQVGNAVAGQYKIKIEPLPGTPENTKKEFNNSIIPSPDFNLGTFIAGSYRILLLKDDKFQCAPISFIVGPTGSNTGGQVTTLPTSPTTLANKCDPKNPSYDPKKAAKECTLAGGIPCGNDPTNPGFQTAIGCIHTSPVGFIKDFLKFILGISGGLAFLMMLLGAFQMLTSAGNPDTLSAGRDRLQSAIIGLLFVIFAVLLLKIIGVDILGLGEQFGFK